MRQNLIVRILPKESTDPAAVFCGDNVGPIRIGIDHPI